MDAIFETERLIPREWTIDDAAAAFAIYGDPEVTRYLGATGEPDPSLAYRQERMPGMVARYTDHPGYGIWAMARRADGAIIGGAGLMTLEEGPEIEFAYSPRRGAWGIGYATDVARGRSPTGSTRSRGESWSESLTRRTSRPTGSC